MSSDPIRDLREMDQLVYQMQTAVTADQLRSAVQRAWAITEKRMRDESNRIGSIMEAEIRKTYGNDPVELKEMPHYNWTQQQTASDFKLMIDTAKPKRGAFE